MPRFVAQHTVGVGANKSSGGAKDFCQTCPKSCATFADKFSSTNIIKTFFGVTSKKRLYVCFSANVERHFLKSNNVGRHFWQGFQGFCPNFQRFFSHFRQIKTFGVATEPPPPTPQFLTGFYRTFFCQKLLAMKLLFYVRPCSCPGSPTPVSCLILSVYLICRILICACAHGVKSKISLDI